MNRTTILVNVVATASMLVLLSSCSSHQAKVTEQMTPAVPTRTTAVAPMPEENGPLKVVHFATNKYNLDHEARRALRFNVKWLKKHADAKVRIEGNCDERGTAEYNQELGLKRAKAVANYLAKRGIHRSRLTTISNGFDHPIDPGHNEMAWAKNRRAFSNVLSQALSDAN